MRISFSAILAAGVALAIASAPVAAQTFGSNAPDNFASPFGRDASMTGTFGTFGTFAESFVTPAGSPVLQSFTFYLGDYIDGADLLLQASVFQFDGDHISGSSLYTSAVRAGSGNDSDFDPYTFTDVNAALTPGTTYAILLRPTASSPDGSTDLVGTTTDESFSLGQLFTSLASTDADLGASGAFRLSDETTYGTDAALQATFGTTATPEPGSFVLMASGLMGVGLIVRRRRRSA